VDEPNQAFNNQAKCSGEMTRPWHLYCLLTCFFCHNLLRMAFIHSILFNIVAVYHFFAQFPVDMCTCAVGHFDLCLD